MFLVFLKNILPMCCHLQDLEDFLQSSGDMGVIIFSLGSYVTHTGWSGFSKRLLQKVLWQCKDVDTLTKDNMPINAKTMTWLPQLDLLGNLIFDAFTNLQSSPHLVGKLLLN